MSKRKTPLYSIVISRSDSYALESLREAGKQLADNNSFRFSDKSIVALVNAAVIAHSEQVERDEEDRQEQKIKEEK